MRMWEILIETHDFESKESGQLALAIHRMTGAQMVRVVSKGRVLRVINRINDDAFVDHDGVHSKIELDNAAGCAVEIVPIDEREMKQAARKAAMAAVNVNPNSRSYWTDVRSKADDLEISDEAASEAQRIINTYGIGTRYE